METNSITAYNRLGIHMELLENDTVKVTQNRLINGYILNQKQLIERGKEVFPDKKIIPVVFSLNVQEIDIAWIEGKMKEFAIKRKDLIKQLAFDESSLSLILSGKRELSKPVRATFFYYFLTYELNRDLRAELENY